LAEYEAAVDKEVKSAIANALAAPWPDMDELNIDVLAAAQ
jgi:TPP-dependent pyruvate/acetoin dehydrogenase alpha subunit